MTTFTMFWSPITSHTVTLKKNWTFVISSYAVTNVQFLLTVAVQLSHMGHPQRVVIISIRDEVSSIGISKTSSTGGLMPLMQLID